MGLFDFVKDAGEKIFGRDEEAREETNEDREALLRRSVSRAGLGAEGLQIRFSEGLATVGGRVKSQEEREKLVLVIGNTEGVARVDDQLTVAAQAVATQTAGAVEAVEAAAGPSFSTMYTVQRGDTLSKIAREHYGNATKYPVIFEANRPMLEDPDRIYPGQVLRIPPLAEKE